MKSDPSGNCYDMVQPKEVCCLLFHDFLLLGFPLKYKYTTKWSYFK